ncbi:MAG: hypothetical protein Q8P57_00475 [Candidatus Pacearchaeota archaeon]|nr:hypothetical protein [Candidatus Pacearchaeota archaeon]
MSKLLMQMNSTSSTRELPTLAILCAEKSIKDFSCIQNFKTKREGLFDFLDSFYLKRIEKYELRNFGLFLMHKNGLK